MQESIKEPVRVFKTSRVNEQQFKSMSFEPKMLSRGTQNSVRTTQHNSVDRSAEQSLVSRSPGRSRHGIAPSKLRAMEQFIQKN